MTKPYKKKLTKKELKHIKAHGMTSMKTIKSTLMHQKKSREDSYEPCWDCRGIARKLGLPV